MSDLDNIKQVINKYMHRLHKSTKLKTEGYTNNNNNNNYESRPQLIKHKKNPFLIFLNNFAMYLAHVAPIILVNANITTLISHTGLDILNLWFPTDCTKYPYGSSTSSPCGNTGIPTLSGPQLEALTKNIEYLNKKNATIGGSVGGGGDDTCVKNPAAFPYNFYKDGSKESLGVGSVYLNWIISSLASTNTEVNSLIKLSIYIISSVYRINDKFKPTIDTLFILFGALLLIPVQAIWLITYISITKNEILGYCW